MNYFDKIKNIIEEKEVNEKVRYLESNKETIKTYFEIGRLLIEAQGGETRAKYGDNLVKEWSIKLSKEYGRGYDYTNLTRMKKLYLMFEKLGTACQQFNLSWSRYRYLLKFDDENERNYYINLCTQNNLSVRKLINAIKEDQFSRLSYADKKNVKLITNNTKSLSINDMLLDPIIINIEESDKLSEKALKRYILKELGHIFMQMGVGFTLVGEEYKLTYLNKNFYADLVLFNYNLNAFTVIELKTKKAKYKDVHQLLLYKDIIDNMLKRDFHNKTIAILISKENDEFIIEYVSDMDILLSSYKFKCEL